METVRFGVIGTSGWMDSFHLPAIQSHPNAQLRAVCGRNRERAEEVAEKYGCNAVYANYEVMLRNEALDAVIIATPEDLHYPMTMLALDQGLHVICEKPLALSAEQGREMYEKAEAKGVKHMIMYTSRWFPVFAYLKQLVDEGYIGMPYHGHFHWLNSWSADPADEYQWYYDPERAHGVVSEVASHMIDLAQWFLGDIQTISASLSTFVDRSQASDLPQDENDSAIILAEFANGAHGTIHCSTISRLASGIRHQDQVVVLHGHDGTLEVHGNAWASPPTAKIMGYRRGDESAQVLDIPDYFYGDAKKDVGFGVFTCNSVGTRLFIDAILNNSAIEPSFEQGWRVQQVVDAAIRSHQSKRQESLPQFAPVLGNT
ncbi:MAG: Gfo/Idh/MocA family oxidoreductase [Anaerolineae bacterium]|nr:Gfo/Idh/MocA family oxidoreductase [Anaerolineae bacterium]